MGRLLRISWAVMQREWAINLRAYRVSFFVATLLSSLFTLLIGFFLYNNVFQGRVTGEFAALAKTDDYMAYLTLGITAFTFTTRMLYPVRNFLVEEREGTLSVMAMMGVPRLAYHFGCIASSGVYSAVEVSVLLLVAYVGLGVSFGAVSAAALVATAVASFVGMYGISLLLSALILSVRDRVVVEAVAFSVMQLVSGVLFPVEYLPRGLQWLSEISPLTHALKGLRGVVLYGAGPAELLPTFVTLITLGLVYSIIGRAVLTRVVTRVLEQTA